jgi:transcriptional regulator with XRE-family HTH domain
MTTRTPDPPPPLEPPNGSLNLRAALTRAGASQRAIGALIGVNQPQVYARLSGTVRWQPGELEKIAAYLGVDLEEILEPGQIVPTPADAP